MTSNQKKLITILIILVLVALGLWLILRKPSDKKSDQVQAGPVIKFPLKYGSTGYGVEQLQKYLNQKYGTNLKVDGIWGVNTEEAAINNLRRDNISETVFYKWNLDKI